MSCAAVIWREDVSAALRCLSPAIQTEPAITRTAATASRRMR